MPKSELCFICVRGRSWGINYYHLSWKRKLGTVKSFKADVSNVTPSLERMGIGLIRSNEGLTLGTSALKPFTVAYLRYQLS